MMHARTEVLLLLLAASVFGGNAGTSFAAGRHADASEFRGLRVGYKLKGGAVEFFPAFQTLRGGKWEPSKDICNECGLPEEYCEFNENCEMGRVRAALHHRGKSPKSPRTASPKGRSASAQREGVEQEELTPRDQATIDYKVKHDHMVADHKAKQKVKPKVVSIKVDKRRANKFTTSVTGLEGFLLQGETLKDIAKILANMLAAGASAKKGENGQQDHIEVQGDRAEEISTYCTEKLKVPSGSIKIMY